LTLLLLLLLLHFLKALRKRVEIRRFIGRLKGARVRGVLRGLKDGVQPPVLVVTDGFGVKAGRRRHGGLRGVGAGHKKKKRQTRRNSKQTIL
jgi:hypothetical protein